MTEGNGQERLRPGLGLAEVVRRGWKFLSPPTPRRVLWVNFAVTYLCNCRCQMCQIWQKYRKEPGLLQRELSLEEIERAFGESQVLRYLEGIGLTGGETFLRPDLVDLAGFFIRRYPGALVSIATNGVRTELILAKTREIVERFSPRFLGLSVSLDGTAVTHDRIRGVEGAYERALQTIEGLRQDSLLRRVQVGVDFTITPDNFEEMPHVFQLSQRLGLKFLANFAQKSAIYFDNLAADSEWSPEGWDRVKQVVAEVARSKIRNEAGMLRLVDPHAYLLLQSPEQFRALKRSFPCHSGCHSFFLDPYGDVYPCIFLGEKLGSIREARFDALWLSPGAEEARRFIRLRRCHCWVACETVPSLMRGWGVLWWNLKHKFLRTG